jgi:predicted phosphate transport protein (TIGR00153 family)
VLPPLSREDLMRLVRRLDLVTDWIKDGGRIFKILIGNKLPKKLESKILDFVREVDRCVRTLGSCINMLYYDFRKSLKDCYGVEKIERKIDHMYMDLLSGINALNLRKEVFFLLVEFIRALETASDECENVADLVRVIIITTIR